MASTKFSDALHKVAVSVDLYFQTNWKVKREALTVDIAAAAIEGGLCGGTPADLTPDVDRVLRENTDRYSAREALYELLGR